MAGPKAELAVFSPHAADVCTVPPVPSQPQPHVGNVDLEFKKRRKRYSQFPSSVPCTYSMLLFNILLKMK